MSEVRDYFTRHPEVVPAEQRAYLAKIEKNQDAGWKALLTGEYAAFRGWPKRDSDQTFDTVLELDEPSQQRIIEKVVEPLQRLAQVHNITAIYPYRGDLPPHVVLQPGRFTNLTPEQQDVIGNWLSSNHSHLNWLSKKLEGLTFHHGSLVIAPSSYICASYFDEEQGTAFRARKIVEKIITRGLGKLKTTGQQPIEGSFAPPSSYYDIFHSSVMRLTEQADPNDLLIFAQEAYSTIGEDLNNNPIPVTIKNLYRGIATDFHKQAPQLVLP